MATPAIKFYSGVRVSFLTVAMCFALLLSSGLSSSCSRKTGCPVNENVHVKPNRKGELPTKGGSSNLFSKKMRKKM